MNRRQLLKSAGVTVTGTAGMGTASANEEYPGLEILAHNYPIEITYEGEFAFDNWEENDKHSVTVHATFVENRVDDWDPYLNLMRGLLNQLQSSSSEFEGYRIRTYELSGGPGWSAVRWEAGGNAMRPLVNYHIAEFSHIYETAGAFLWFDEAMSRSYANLNAWKRIYGLRPYEDIEIGGFNGYLDHLEENDPTPPGTFSHGFVGDRADSPTTAAHELGHLLIDNEESSKFADDKDESSDHQLGSIATQDNLFTIMAQRSGTGLEMGSCSTHSEPDHRTTNTSPCTDIAVSWSIMNGVRDVEKLSDGTFIQLGQSLVGAHGGSSAVLYGDTVCE